jgi:hypothetical protein
MGGDLMASWVTPAEVIGSWIGGGAPSDQVLIQVWIDKAERAVRTQVPNLMSRIDAEAEEDPPRKDLLDVARDVVVAMVTRVFRNPEGLRQTNTTTGPFSEMRTYGGDTPGVLGLTDEEFQALSGTRGGAFEIDLVPASSRFA